MGIGLLIGFLILLILIIIAIVLLIHFIKRKSKAGIGISIFLLVFVSIVLLTNNIDEITIDKQDVINDLNILNIELKEDFKILNNDVSGMPERLQETKLKISKNDACKIIATIKNSKNYVDLRKGNDDFKFSSSTEKQIENFRDPKFHIRQFYDEIDNIPTRLSIYIENGSTILEYKKFEY